MLLSQVFEAVPESLLACFKNVCADEILYQYYPAIRNLLLALLRNAEESFYNNFRVATSVISSMKSVKGFVEETKNMVFISFFLIIYIRKIYKDIVIDSVLILSVSFSPFDILVDNTEL